VESERSEQLAKRIQLLDRAHRPISRGAGVVAAVIVLFEFHAAGTVLENYGAILGIAIGIAVWWISEVLFGAALAVYETEQHHLLRTRGLPQATVRRRK